MEGWYEWTNGMKSLNMALLFSHSHLPKIYQAFLMSATLSDDVQALKELVLHNPVSVGGIVFNSFTSLMN